MQVYWGKGVYMWQEKRCYISLHIWASNTRVIIRSSHRNQTIYIAKHTSYPILEVYLKIQERDANDHLSVMIIGFGLGIYVFEEMDEIIEILSK